MIVSNTEVAQHIDGLTPGKSAGPDGIPVEVFKHASPRISTLLSCCFSTMIVHGTYQPH